LISVKALDSLCIFEKGYESKASRTTWACCWDVEDRGGCRGLGGKRYEEVKFSLRSFDNGDDGGDGVDVIDPAPEADPEGKEMYPRLFCRMTRVV
jgi:hypothetical protein